MAITALRRINTVLAATDIDDTQKVAIITIILGHKE